jgi:integration host factor subunit alpha
MALTKAELAEALINKVAFNKRDAKDLVDIVFETLRLSLER